MRRLLAPVEVAEYLGIGKSTVYAIGVLDQIQPVAIGGHKKYDIRDVDAWIDRRKAEQAAWIAKHYGGKGRGKAA